MPLTSSTSVGDGHETSVAPEPSDQTPARIRGMFAQITPSYDRLNIVFSGAVDRYWRRVAATELTRDLSSARRILDVATGTGDLARAVRRAAPSADVVGVDFTRPMLVRAQQKYGRGGFDWIEGDGLRLPFADGSFDAACIAFGLRNMVDKPAGLREIRRVLRPGGRIAVLEFYTPANPLFARLYDFYSFQVMPRVGRLVSGSDAYGYLTRSIRAYWSVDEAVRQLGAAGFENVRVRPLTAGVACIHLGEAR